MLLFLKSHNNINYSYSMNSSESEVIIEWFPKQFESLNARNGLIDQMQRWKYKPLKKIISYPNRASGYSFPFQIEEMPKVCHCPIFSKFSLWTSRHLVALTWSLCLLFHNVLVFLLFIDHSLCLAAW